MRNLFQKVQISQKNNYDHLLRKTVTARYIDEPNKEAKSSQNLNRSFIPSITNDLSNHNLRRDKWKSKAQLNSKSAVDFNQKANITKEASKC